MTPQTAEMLALVAVAQLGSTGKAFVLCFIRMNTKTADCLWISRNKSSDVDFKIKSYTDFANLIPDSFTFNEHLGLLYGKDKNDLLMAVTYFKRALEIAPKDVNALRGLSHAYTLLSDYETAAFYFKRIADGDAGKLALLGSLRSLYGQAGDRANEEEVAKRMEELQQEHDQVVAKLLGRLLILPGRSAIRQRGATSIYFAVTAVAEPSYLTTWSMVAVTPAPVPCVASTQTTLNVRLAGIPV